MASATYDASTGMLGATAAGNGDNFTTNAANIRPRPSLPFTGEDGHTYTLTGGAVSDVEQHLVHGQCDNDPSRSTACWDNNGTQSTGNKSRWRRSAGGGEYQIAAGSSFDVGGSASR